MKFPRFEPLLQAGAKSRLNVTSYRCRVHTGAAGTNWLIAGEAASMVDPITANGVTAALRHAAEASRLILKYRSAASCRCVPGFATAAGFCRWQSFLTVESKRSCTSLR